MATRAALRVVPLGGLGRIGGNLMVYETAEDLIVVDCGVLFPNEDEPGVQYVVPDIAYIEGNTDKLRGIIITHGHEDHIGALPWVLGRVSAPVYATGFTRALIESKFEEYPNVDIELHEVGDGERFEVGGFTVEAIAVNHSIPDSIALAIDTPVGKVIHTGDFKDDPHPVDGRKTNFDRLRELGEAGVTLLLSDSTNAERLGHTWSEQEVGEALRPLIAEAPQRVAVTTFSSNVHRAQLVIDAAVAAGRKVVPVGGSMEKYVRLAREDGFLDAPRGAIVDVEKAGHLPRSKVAMLVSGCQGEPRSALGRLSVGDHYDARLDRGDRVIFSSRRIPGNERVISAVMSSLIRLGTEVVDDRTARVHTSGHGFVDEHRKMLEACKPEYFVPLHGEFRHMNAHAATAVECGVGHSNIFVLEDGHPIELLKKDGRVRVNRLREVDSGHIYLEGDGKAEVGEVVLNDRRIMGRVGLIACVVAIDRAGRIVAGPDLMTRGVVHVDESEELLMRANDEVRVALEDLDAGADNEERSNAIRTAVRRFFRRELGRRPLVVPLVMDTE